MHKKGFASGANMVRPRGLGVTTVIEKLASPDMRHMARGTSDRRSTMHKNEAQDLDSAAIPNTVIFAHWYLGRQRHFLALESQVNQMK